MEMSRILLPRLHFVFITDSKVSTLDLSGGMILGAKGAKGFFILRPFWLYSFYNRIAFEIYLALTGKRRF